MARKKDNQKSGPSFVPNSCQREERWTHGGGWRDGKSHAGFPETVRGNERAAPTRGRTSEGHALLVSFTEDMKGCRKGWGIWADWLGQWKGLKINYKNSIDQLKGKDRGLAGETYLRFKKPHQSGRLRKEGGS